MKRNRQVLLTVCGNGVLANYYSSYVKKSYVL